MFLSYDGIVFDMLFLDGWQVEADLSNDGVDFLRWHHIIDVTCILNQDATAAYKFPAIQPLGESINRRQAQEFQQRMLNKQNDPSTPKMKTGQMAGEDVKKSLKQFENFLNNINLFGIFSQTPITLPSGKKVSPPAAVPSNVAGSAGQSYPTWDRPLPSVRFEQNVGGQQGSTYNTPDGGNTSGEAANVSPANIDATATSQSAVGNIFEGAIDIAKGKFQDGAAKIGIGGIQIAVSPGSLIPDVGQIISSWWKDLKQTLIDLGDQLGITSDDIFGVGRQPLKNVSFPTPPPKRNLFSGPIRTSSAAGSGWTVPITFQELTNRLAKSGRTLAIWLNSGPDGSPEYMLFSPYAGLTCDALTGPRCHFMNLPAIHGNVTGILKLRFETWVAPPPEIVFADQLVLGQGLFNDKLKTPGSFNDKLKTPGFDTSFTDKLHTPNFSQQQNVTDPASLLAGGLVQAVPNLSAQSGISFLAGSLVFGASPGGTPTVGVPLVGGVNNRNVASGKVNPGTGISGNRLALLTPPLISNRWTMRQEPDPATQLNTTVIEGTAHFRLDVLQALQLTADQLRPWFMHPIPFGYVRMPPTVTTLSDGASVQYQIVDVQQMMNNPGGQRWGVHSVKARQVMGYNSPIDFVRAPFAPPSLIPPVVAGIKRLF